MIFNVLWSDKTFGGAEIYVRKMERQFNIPFISLKDKTFWQKCRFLVSLLNPKNRYIFHDTRASLFSLIRFLYFKDMCVLHGPGKHARAIYFLHQIFNLYCYKIILVNRDIFSKKSSQKFEVIENESSLQASCQPSEINALYFGRVEASKAVDKLCEAWQQTKTHATLHIIGDGSLRTSLDQKHENIVFHGALSHQELTPIINQCAVYIRCRPREGKSLALMEAMSAGLIPIVSNIESQQFLSEALNLPLITDDNELIIIENWLSSKVEFRQSTSKKVREYSETHLQGNWERQWQNILQSLR